MDEPKQMRRAAKIGHRKSRNGCVTCKSRRVKCNEARPTCGNCLRLGLDCAWSADPPMAPPPARSPSSPSVGNSPNSASVSASASTSALTPESALGLGPDHLKREASSTATSPAAASPAIGSSYHNATYDHRYQSQQHQQNIDYGAIQNLHQNHADAQDAVENMWSVSALSDALQASPNPNGKTALPGSAPSEELPYPESRARRLLEHRLMHVYMTTVGAPHPKVPNRDWSDIWSHKIPELSLRFDNLLYAILTSSCTYVLTLEPDNREMFSARQRYLMAAMRAQRTAVDNLSYETADAACFGSMLLNITAFAMMNERSLTPYTPPLEWLQLGKGAGAVIWMCVDAVHHGPVEVQKNSSMLAVAQAYPRFGFDTSYFDASHRDQFAGVMNRALPGSMDTWDAETTDAYEKALSYVGSVQNAVTNGEPPHVLARRAQGFSLVVPAKFIDFLAERRPRALVILAHYFAVVYQIPNVWWLGQSETHEGRERLAKKEIRALKEEIPTSWRVQMLWPMDVVGLVFENN